MNFSTYAARERFHRHMEALVFYKLVYRYSLFDFGTSMLCSRVISLRAGKQVGINFSRAYSNFIAQPYCVQQHDAYNNISGFIYDVAKRRKRTPYVLSFVHFVLVDRDKDRDDTAVWYKPSVKG